MTIIATLPGGFVLSRESQLGTSPYAAPEQITMSDLTKVDEVLSVRMTGGFVPAVSAIVGNVVDVDVFGQDASQTDNDPLRELTAGDLTGETITVVAIGT